MRTIPVALALVACALPGQATAAAGSVSDERAADGYKTYVACSNKASGKPSHECKLSQPKAAYFVSKKHDATYKVCVKFPGEKRLCASAQDAPTGKKKIVTIATANTGTHKVAWYVDGKKVGGWNFEVTAG
jgi:curli biogenesis system outer membrane secretion channel CsgG